MSASEDLSFSLQPVVEGDIPALTALSGLSFAADRHTQLKAAHPTKPYDHAAGTPDSIRHWLSLPQKVEMTKAVDNKTGEIIGCVGWVFRGFDRDRATSAAVPHEVTEKPQEQAPSPAPPPLAPDSASGSGPDHVSALTDPDPQAGLADPLEQLAALTDGHLAAFMGRVMPPGARCMFITGIQVHPEHQGKGVGRALVRQGTARADAEGVFCWVHSSDAGARLFPHCGFEAADSLEVDLDVWAARMGLGPPAGRDCWGTYTFRCYVRQAQLIERRGN